MICPKVVITYQDAAVMETGWCRPGKNTEARVSIKTH